MKINLIIFFAGMIIVLAGVYLKINDVAVASSILLLLGLMIEAYSIIKIIQLIFFRSKSESNK